MMAGMLLSGQPVLSQTYSTPDTLSQNTKEEPPLIQIPLSKGNLTFNLYGDFGYVFGPQKTHTYFDPIADETVTDFGRRDFTSYPLYANQFSLSYGFVQGQYELKDKLKFKLAFHTGHIVDALYLEEIPSTRIIRELSLYYHLHPKWALEIGIFPSYFGAEIVLNKENLHATRAYIADFTPDYEAGVRLHYKADEHHTFSAMLLNGWQVIKETNATKAFALAWTLNKPGKIVGNWNLMFANEQPLSAPQPLFRHYQNIYFRIWLSNRLMILPVLDAMIEQKQGDQSTGWNKMIAPAFSVRYGLGEKLGVAGRYERIYDPKSLIPELKTDSPSGWQNQAVTLTLEYLPLNLVTFRIEGKYGTHKDAVFRNSTNQLVREDWYGIVSSSFYF
ncbi:porin [Algoriphagus confluentis]|uniref:Porin n=2 Tax=Algoriphagus confluentis TaxID=1697556 RepID=A0ABQ6PQN0_9BACT|nr:porin [Algoriphagus confluentis]